MWSLEYDLLGSCACRTFMLIYSSLFASLAVLIIIRLQLLQSRMCRSWSRPLLPHLRTRLPSRRPRVKPLKRPR